MYIKKVSIVTYIVPFSTVMFTPRKTTLSANTFVAETIFNALTFDILKILLDKTQTFYLLKLET